MDALFTLTTLEQLRALSNPLRIDILNQMTTEPRTVAQIAGRLALAPTKLYFHIAELERAGLAIVVKTETRGNLLERHYQAAAEHFIVDKSLFRAQGQAGLEVFSRSLAAVLDKAALGLESAVAQGRVTAAEAEQSLAADTDLRLSPERLAEFRGRLSALLAEFEVPETAGETGHLSVVFYPVREKPVGEKEEIA